MSGSGRVIKNAPDDIVVTIIGFTTDARMEDHDRDNCPTTITLMEQTNELVPSISKMVVVTQVNTYEYYLASKRECLHKHSINL